MTNASYTHSKATRFRICICLRRAWIVEKGKSDWEYSLFQHKSEKDYGKSADNTIFPSLHALRSRLNEWLCVCECGTRKHGRLYVCPIIYNLYSQNVRCICDSGCWHTVLYILMLLFSVVFVYIPRSARFYFVQSKVDVQTVRTDHTPSASFRRMKTFPHTHKHSHTLQTFLLLLQINSIRFARSF